MSSESWFPRSCYTCLELVINHVLRLVALDSLTSPNPPLCSRHVLQESLAQLINQQTTDEHMMLILTTMWYIWKARNDHRFQNKPWNVWQVHHAVAAEIAASSLQEHDQAHHEQDI